MASGFSMDTSKFKNAKHLDAKIDRAISGVMKYWDGPVEKYMKLNAPWTDRTTNARNGLKAEAVKGLKFEHSIVLSHAVDYGIYLETSNDGKYAIIQPTIDVMGPKVIKFCTKLMDRLDKSVGGST